MLPTDTGSHPHRPAGRESPDATSGATGRRGAQRVTYRDAYEPFRCSVGLFGTEKWGDVLVEFECEGDEVLGATVGTRWMRGTEFLRALTKDERDQVRAAVERNSHAETCACAICAPQQDEDAESDETDAEREERSANAREALEAREDGE